MQMEYTSSLDLFFLAHMHGHLGTNQSWPKPCCMHACRSDIVRALLARLPIALRAVHAYTLPSTLYTSPMEYLNKTTGFSIMVAAASKTGIVHSLADPDLVATIFMPNDAVRDQGRDITQSIYHPGP